jgi:hypothetical protein
VATHLETLESEGMQTEEDIEDIRGAAATIYAGSSETDADFSNLISLGQGAWRPFVPFISSTNQQIFTYYWLQTWSTIMIFILTMTLFQDKQKRAQEEIDTVIGPNRLPEFSDRKSLPYVECLMQEVLRYAFCFQPSLVGRYYYRISDGILLHLLVTRVFVFQ